MIELIGVPIYAGADKKGVDLGPDRIRECCRREVFIDAGNCYVPPVCTEERENPKMKYKQVIISTCQNLQNIVKNTILNKNIPLVVGGDHSLSLGSISAVSSAYKNVGVVYLDAHGDINTDRTTLTGHIHGMTLAAAMGIGNKELTEIAYKGKTIDPRNVFFIGTRSLDPGEESLIKEKEMNVCYMQTITQKGIGWACEWLEKKLKERNIENIHFSIDIDALDPSLAPGTGVKERDGMNLNDFYSILNSVLDTHLVRSVDLVEYNPLLDKEEKTLKICQDTVDLLFEKLV